MAISLKIIEKLGNIPTLEELYLRTKVVFVGIGFCLARREVEYIHKETYSSMSILDVICISLSTPGIYHPLKIDGNLWIDGSIVEPFSPNSIELESGRILAITTKRKKVLFTNRDPIGQNVNLIRSVFESMRQVTALNNMILVEIDSKDEEEALNLREGWNSYMSIYKPITPESDVGAELQS
jgi:predicted acylesterase/phospholipase RssA